MKSTGSLCLFLCLSAHAAIIRVPQNQLTIQAAINAAHPGDTVVVAPGTYYENISFLGKNIIVKSSQGPKVTTIDGGNLATVVTFDMYETNAAVLQGFTIQHGSASYDGGGIYVDYASPRITRNVIANNTACGSGPGIALEFSSAWLESNIIKNNSEAGCTGGSGGGLFVGGLGYAHILGNVIQNNTANFGGGVGILASSPSLVNNVIHSNVANASPSQGGGVWMIDGDYPVLLQNLIYNNTAAEGSGVYFSGLGDGPGSQFVSNTIIGTKSSPQGSALYVLIYQPQVQIANNILIGARGTNAVYCSPASGTIPAEVNNNDAYSPAGSGLGGACASQAGQDGNLSVDPLFLGSTFRPQPGSPVIDAGDDSALALSADLAGNPRVVDGLDNDGDGVIDMGVYEYQPPAN